MAELNNFSRTERRLSIGWEIRTGRYSLDRELRSMSSPPQNWSHRTVRGRIVSPPGPSMVEYSVHPGLSMAPNVVPPLGYIHVMRQTSDSLVSRQVRSATLRLPVVVAYQCLTSTLLQSAVVIEKQNCYKTGIRVHVHGWTIQLLLTCGTKPSRLWSSPKGLQNSGTLIVKPFLA